MLLGQSFPQASIDQRFKQCQTARPVSVIRRKQQERGGHQSHQHRNISHSPLLHVVDDIVIEVASSPLWTQVTNLKHVDTQRSKQEDVNKKQSLSCLEHRDLQPGTDLMQPAARVWPLLTAGAKIWCLKVSKRSSRAFIKITVQCLDSSRGLQIRFTGPEAATTDLSIDQRLSSPRTT